MCIVHDKTWKNNTRIMIYNCWKCCQKFTLFARGCNSQRFLTFLIRASSLGLIVARKCSGKCKHPLGNQISRRVVSITYNFFPSLHITNRPFAQVISLDERWLVNRGDYPGGQLNLGRKENILCKTLNVPFIVKIKRCNRYMFLLR